MILLTYLLTYTQAHKKKVNLDFRLLDHSRIGQFNQMLSFIKDCDSKQGYKEIHIDGTDMQTKYFQTSTAVSSSNLQNLVYQSSRLCEWLIIKDCIVDFTIFNPTLAVSKDQTRSLLCDKNHVAKMKTQCRATSLTIIDSKVYMLHKLLDAFNSKNQLKQLVFIFSEDCEQEFKIVEELVLADIIKFKKLEYFELSFYNDVQQPFIDTDNVNLLISQMPLSTKEVCIYSQDECTDVTQLIKPELTNKFYYLELGFYRVFQPLKESINIESLFASANQNRYKLEVGPAQPN